MGPCSRKQKDRLETQFAGEDHVEVEATWGIHQRIVAAYREPDRTRGRGLMNTLIESGSQGVPRERSRSSSRSGGP